MHCLCPYEIDIMWNDKKIKKPVKILSKIETLQDKIDYLAKIEISTNACVYRSSIFND